MDKLNLLTIFIRVVDAGSFAGAAVVLGTSPSTISKAISKLEKHLGFRLFTRTTRQLQLTLEGETYANTVRTTLDHLESSEQSLREDIKIPQGVLKINVPMSYGRLYILPLIAAFKEQYPAIDFEISFADKYIDLIENNIDLCVRSGTLEDSRFIAKQLSPMDFITCVSSKFIEQFGYPKEYADYSAFPWIRFRFKQTGRLMPILAYDEDDILNLDPGRQFVVDDGEAMMRLCADGVAVTQAPHFIVRDWLYRKDVVAIGTNCRPKQFGIFAIYAQRESLPEKIRVFIEFLEEQLKAGGETTYTTWAETWDYL